jgi:D-alanine-D-alanine ligase
VFVKPAHLGSSVGIVKVCEPAAAAAALEQAFAHDELAIVEACGRGIEVVCGVLGLPGGEAMASEPGEILFAGEFYDYDAKYTAGGMDLIVPARISPAARSRVMELALETFAQTGCEGLARVDFFVNGDRVLVNELNTMPGFTPTSVYAKLLSASGVPYPELLERLCRLGIERHEQRRRHRH